MVCGTCRGEDVTIRFNGQRTKVTQAKGDSISVNTDGATVYVESLYESYIPSIVLKGSSDDGRLVLKTNGKAKVTLAGLNLTSREGAPLHLKNKKKVEVEVAKGTVNTLAITACNDTANNKAAAIWAKDKLLLSGKGRLNVIATGDGCRGIKAKKDITIEDITLDVTTSGNNLGEKPFAPPEGFPGDFDGMPPFDPNDMPEGMFPDMPEGMFPEMPEGGFPDMPEGGFGGKHKYIASAKGIASKGKITVNSGNVSVRTSTAGAEGIEGKEGVGFNGGNVDVLAADDAVNAGACIEFNGASVTARSTGNDAVDSNPKSGFFSPFGNNGQSDEPAIVIRGGTVNAWSQVGSPEEGLDCDYAALIVEGGKVFSVGGGMGEMPSVPTNENAKQPTALLIGLGIEKDEPIYIHDADNKLIDTVTIPFSLRRSASLVSSPAFKTGKSYTIKTKGYERSFTFKENFTIVR